jgi:predicted transcriptional regulator
MSKREPHGDLSRRERQIMDVLYQAGRASVADIQGALPDPPTYTAVRTLLGILEQKGHITHHQDGPRFVYEPTVPRDEMAKSAIDRVMRTFFDGSVERVVATLLDREERAVSNEELERLAELIEQARREGQ